MIMWTVRDLDCAYGMAVTASHNPATYNGLKVFTEGGRDAKVKITEPIQCRANSISTGDIRRMHAPMLFVTA